MHRNFLALALVALTALPAVADSVLKTGTDGSLALAEDPRGAAADADLGDVLYGLNLAIAAAAITLVFSGAVGRSPSSNEQST